jgi:hypothetical protein
MEAGRDQLSSLVISEFGMAVAQDLKRRTGYREQKIMFSAEG